MSLHLYVAEKQPATRFRDASLEAAGCRFVVSHPPNLLLPTVCCRKRRPAKNLTAQVYYDCVHFACVTGKGCKR